MKKLACFLLLAASIPGSAAAQQNDLSGLTIVIDPGHGGANSNDRYIVPDAGTNFYESESNFQKALLLRSMLEALGANVILTRNTNRPDTSYAWNDGDPDEPALSARVAVANANDADWFHSIHSNATGLPLGTNTSTNYTLVLVREKRSLTDPGASTGNGMGVAEYPEAVTMSNMMGPAIQARLRNQMRSTWTYLDWTFYGGSNGGYSLGVLRGLLMPGELSEGSMHDCYPETRRLMSNAYRKMEAYALRNAFMQYFGVPADTLCIVAGLQTQISTNALVNNSHVRVLPENILYTGDVYNNGFFMLDGLHSGPHTVRFETPGYFPDSVQVDLAPGIVAFVDRSLTPTGLPTVKSSSPVDNDTAFTINRKIVFNFSKPMDTLSVASAFVLSPSCPGTLSWSSNNSTLTFAPKNFLPSDLYFTATIGATARSAYGEAFDGNGDGNPGDPYIVHFKTRFVDAVPPFIVSRYPDSGNVVVSPNHLLNITFSEPVNPSTVSMASIQVGMVGGGLQARTVQYYPGVGKGAAVAYINNTFQPGKTYLVRVGGVADTAGNSMSTTTPVSWQFSVAPGSYQFTLVDSLAADLGGWFSSPSQSGSTVGLDSASWSFDPTQKVPNIAGNSGSACMTYRWDTTKSSWLIREYLNSGPAKSVAWKKDNTILQVFIYGDGSNTQFRFCVDDNATAHEVSRWYSIDWVGWRLVEWDLQNDTTFAWEGGNGVLDGDLNFDSFQLQYVPGVSAAAGRIYFDQLQVVQRTAAGVGEGRNGIPAAYALEQNYPNPFNPKTTIKSTVGGAGGQGSGVSVKLAIYDLLGREVKVLVNERRPAGYYEDTFDASGLASGVYVYRLTAGSFVQSRKMVLVK